MADIFLSYKREDQARAARIVAALRDSGRSVWWDEGLTPRQAWDATIEQEIAAAAHVIVLWSPRAAASDWVRTEAHYAQDHAKLVPVIIEPCDIPLAFMLKQAVDLSRWHGGKSDPAWLKLLDWLDADADPAAAHQPSHGGAPYRQPGIGRWTLVVAAAIIVALLAGGLFTWLRSSAQTDSIVVAPFDAPAGDKAAAAFSQGFAADLAQIVTGGGSNLKVIDGKSGGSSAKRAAFVLNGNVRSNGSDLTAKLTLNAADDGSIIWSTSLKRPIAQTDAMHNEAEVRMGSVFICALDATARDRSIVSLDALRVYLRACEALPSGDDMGTRKLLRDVVAAAPKFAQGWATLAEWNGFIAADGDDEAPAARREALDAATRALAIDPRNSSAWVARAMVKTKISEWPAAQADLAKALSLNPNDPIGNFFVASNLVNVGRMSEALDYAKRGAGSGPRFWPKTLQVITTLADLGATRDAQQMLAAARQTWPDEPSLLNFAATLAGRYVDPAQAPALLDDPAIKTAFPPDRIELLRLSARLRARPDAADMEAATRLIAKSFKGHDNAFGSALNYIVIGRIDDAYATLATLRQPLPNVAFGLSPAGLFRPFAAKFRADPRFMPLMRDMGLLSIWETTKKWPDFCRSDGEVPAPYDCRAVAARLDAASVSPAASRSAPPPPAPAP